MTCTWFIYTSGVKNGFVGQVGLGPKVFSLQRKP